MVTHNVIFSQNVHLQFIFFIITPNSELYEAGGQKLHKIEVFFTVTV